MRLRTMAAALLSALLCLLTTAPAHGQAADPAVLSVAVSSAAVTTGQPVRVLGRLTVGDAGLPGRSVQLQRRVVGTTAWTHVGTLTTDADGAVQGQVQPTDTQDLRLVAGDATSLAVRVAVAWSLTSRLSARSVQLGRTVSLSGTLRPAVAGHRVHLQQWSGGVWRAVTSAPVTTAGAFSFAVRPSASGWSAYRVWTGSDPRHTMATGLAHWVDAYRHLHTYVVQTRGSVTVDLAAFRAEIAATYADSRGWARSSRRFQRVASAGSFTVVLSEARYLPSFSPACSVQYSCRVGRYIIINQDRWRVGSPGVTGSLTSYRQMVTNHETGHWLGLGHASCPSVGAPAPVMQQQSKALLGCTPNPWPLAREIAALS